MRSIWLLLDDQLRPAPTIPPELTNPEVRSPISDIRDAKELTVLGILTLGNLYEIPMI